MSFIHFGASTGTQTMLDHKDYNYLFIAPYLKWAQTLLIASS